MTQKDYEDKMHDRFATFDRDGDGAVTIQDFEAMADEILATFKVAPGSAKATALKDGARMFFTGLAAATDADGSGGITEAEFVAGASARLLNNPNGFTQIARPWAESVVAIADADGDGVVTAAEWQRMLVAMGSTPGGIAEEVAVMDTDRDGRIDVGEVLDSAVVFYTSDQPRNAFAGR